jgi:hypothetical protein
VQDPLRELLRSIHRYLQRPVSDRWVREPFQSGRAVRCHVHTVRRDQARRDVLDDETFHDLTHARQSESVGDRLAPGQGAQVRQRRVHSVEGT